ncbi:phage shock protein A [Desulfohalotomaculum tongense]|uniref:hypothetical protein n=1 Tax=Desulforadius tongensis TaxID=1216062 RepID=UPI001957AEDB|nr:hypothetical protein [Desulforadius tongensis]MBM7854202.1 phage shock protein A [Desulforadius tongensis]
MAAVVNNLLVKLLEMSRQKEKLMHEILQTGERLAGAGDDWELVDKLLAARQKYMDEIDGLDRQIENLKQKIAAFAGAGSWKDVGVRHAEAVNMLEDTWRRSAEMAVEAKRLTDKSREQVEKKLKELQQNMKKLQSSKPGLAAYHKKPKQNSGYFLDQKK